jgi:hypothetical protein
VCFSSPSDLVLPGVRSRARGHPAGSGSLVGVPDLRHPPDGAQVLLRDRQGSSLFILLFFFQGSSLFRSKFELQIYLSTPSFPRLNNSSISPSFVNTYRTETDVMILKIFSSKKLAKISFFAQTTAIFAKLDHITSTTNYGLSHFKSTLIDIQNFDT